LINVINHQLVADRVGELQAEILSKSDNPVRIVAVTKGFGVQAVIAANRAGVDDIGENYAQEMVAKKEMLANVNPDSKPRWHFIGNLQRNKVKKISSHVFLWQSVNSIPLGEEIIKRCKEPQLLIQVNMTGAKNQGGLPPSEAPAFVERLRGIDVNILGLMTIGDHGDREATLKHFQNLRTMANSLDLPECSMGMSNDYDLAIEAGATILRLGTAIFGNRDED
tara:strand:+ start:295 stop:963 length:669 start_codon:yes stop_codon:yes gene_type:complete